MIEQFLKDYAEIIKELGEEAHDLFLAYLGSEMNLKQTEAGFKSGSQAFSPKNAAFKSKLKLDSRSGKLFRSFNQRDKETLTKLSISKDKINLSVGSNLKYARIQDIGGFIKAKKKAKPGGRAIWAMEGLMWHYFIETNNRMYYRIAMGIRANGGVNIRGTHYFSNAINDMKKDGFNRIYEQLIERLAQYV